MERVVVGRRPENLLAALAPGARLPHDPVVRASVLDTDGVERLGGRMLLRACQSTVCPNPKRLATERRGSPAASAASIAARFGDVHILQNPNSTFSNLYAA
ncbi:MAG: hypothetical protein ABR880_23185 [Candidatus Sulfotelmatobacter sp.]